MQSLIRKPSTMVTVALDTNVVVALVDDRDTWHSAAVAMRTALLEAQVRMVPELGAGLEVRRGRDFDGDLAQPFGRRQALPAQHVEQPLQPRGHRAIVLVRLILFCSCTRP